MLTPQTNGIVERFHKTILNEFYQVTFRKQVYSSIEQLQTDLDDWLNKFNTQRTHQGKMCNGRTPLETLIDGKKIWQQKNVAQTSSDSHSVRIGNCQIKSRLLQFSRNVETHALWAWSED